ncbi:alpha/beta family hydrolase [Microbacterium sp.]|uniref:alpha/beta hydrolase family protein n=1 Tax=Microbacterium sp. TaxID=51671 RepID=UPI0039E4B8FD
MSSPRPTTGRSDRHPLVKVPIPVELPAGVVEVSADWEPGAGRPALIVAHGAGAGKDHPFLTGFTEALGARGFGTLRFNFPYAEQGRRMPGPAAHAIAAWHAVVGFVREQDPDVAVWAIGKSYGGRMASMAVAEGLEVAGLVYLGYPLHAPGKPEKPRAEHLPAIVVPQLFIEGTNDPFIQPLAQFDEVVAGCQDVTVVWVEGGGHTFEVKGRRRPASEIGSSLVTFVSDFVTR